MWSPGRRPLARDSLQSPRNLSALRVWQRCLEKGSTEAARSCSSPFGSPTPRSRALLLPAPRPRPPPPSFSDRELCGSSAGANLELPPRPPGKKLGQLGLEAASHSRSWSPGVARASGSPGEGLKSWLGLQRPPRGHEGNLPQCLEQRLQRGWRRRAP